MINNAVKKQTIQELVGYVEVMDSTPYLVGDNSDWDPGANHSFFPCLSVALVLWTTENSYEVLTIAFSIHAPRLLWGSQRHLIHTCSITTFHIMDHHVVFSYIVQC